MTIPFVFVAFVLLVFVATSLLQAVSVDVEEVVVIALTAAATFSIRDIFIPAMGTSARGGAGFGLGTGLVGGLRLA